jgi:hypothetical protein
MDNTQGEYHSVIRGLRQRWDAEDAERDRLERTRHEIFLAGHASQIFAPVEDYLTRLDKVLRALGASIEIGAAWEILDEEKLRRVARVKASKSAQQLALAFIIQGASILHDGRSYQFSQDTEALIRVITRKIEDFLAPGEKGSPAFNRAGPGAVAGSASRQLRSA